MDSSILIQIVSGVVAILGSGIGVYIGLRVGLAEARVQIDRLNNDVNRLQEAIDALRGRVDNIIDSRAR